MHIFKKPGSNLENLEIFLKKQVAAPYYIGLNKVYFKTHS